MLLVFTNSSSLFLPPEQGENVSWWMEPDHRDPDTPGKGNMVCPELRSDQGMTGGMKMNGSGEDRRQN